MTTMTEEAPRTEPGRARALLSTADFRLLRTALTAYARHEDRARALAADFQVHLTKPVSPADLVRVVQACGARCSDQKLDRQHEPQAEPSR